MARFCVNARVALRNASASERAASAAARCREMGKARLQNTILGGFNSRRCTARV
jgi:hypothetical protein